MHTLRLELGSNPLRVAVIGTGGTGSSLLSHLPTLHAALQAKQYAGLAVTAFDPDTVSEANLVRQRFYAQDIGMNKAVTLVRRINLSCQTDWQAVPERFDCDWKRYFDLIISCVDTRAARHELHQGLLGRKYKQDNPTYWLDCGNDQVTGQVILGTPDGSKAQRLEQTSNLLPCATDLHPELMDTKKPENDTPSCSTLEALEKQDLYINLTVANHALDMLWQLLKNGQVAHHARYFNTVSASLASSSC